MDGHMFDGLWRCLLLFAFAGGGVLFGLGLLAGWLL